ncbi:FixH family protein [Pseudomonadota bacterium]
MNSRQQDSNNAQIPGMNEPWYRQFWPWFIIALPASAVIASFITLWLAVSNPVTLVVNDEEYRELNSGLKAQVTVKENQEAETGGSDPQSN